MAAPFAFNLYYCINRDDSAESPVFCAENTCDGFRGLRASLHGGTRIGL